MKKFRHIAALALAALLALSCAKETQPEGAGEMVTIEYGITVDSPTKALGDGKTANYVWYALYRSNGTLMSTCTTPAKIDIATGKAICPVTMVKDQDFKVVFLAMYFDEVNGNKIPAYKIDANQKTVSMPASLQANTDKFDLFYGVDNVVNFQGVQSTNVNLNRVVAQINFKLSEEAWNDLGAGQSLSSQIQVSGAPTSMSLWDGTLDYTESITYTYTKAAIPAEGRKVGTAYCFASSTGDQKVDAAITVYKTVYNEEEVVKTASVTSIPVSSNKKTNLIISSLH